MVKNYRTTRSQAGMMICTVCSHPIDRPGDFDKNYFKVNDEYIHDNGVCFLNWLNEHKKKNVTVQLNIKRRFYYEKNS